MDTNYCTTDNSTYSYAVHFKEQRDIHQRASAYLSIPLCSIAIIVNILVITAISLIKGKISPRLILAVNLLFSTLLVSVWVLLEKCLPFLPQIHQCHTMIFFGPEAYISTNLFLVLISIDHYYAITKSLSYNAIITRKKTFVAVSLVWVLQFLVLLLDPLIGIIYHLDDPGIDLCKSLLKTHLLYPWSLFVYIALIYFCLILIVVIYITVCRTTRMALRRSSLPAGQNTIHEPKGTTKRYTVLTCLLISTCLTFSLPECIFNTILSILRMSEGSIKIPCIPLFITSQYIPLVRILYSISAPIIYISRVADIRRVFTRRHVGTQTSAPAWQCQ